MPTSPILDESRAWRNIDAWCGMVIYWRDAGRAGPGPHRVLAWVAVARDIYLALVAMVSEDGLITWNREAETGLLLGGDVQVVVHDSLPLGTWRWEWRDEAGPGATGCP